MQVEIKLDKKKLREIEIMLRGVKNGMPRVVSGAINKTAAPAKTQISREIRQEIAVKAKDVKKSIILKKASYTKWAALISISRRRLPVIVFGAKQNKKGVSYRIQKTGGRKRIGSAFIATMKSGHTGVFKRKGAARLPIVQLRGPSLGEVFDKNVSLVQRITTEAYKRLDHNIYDQLNYVLSRRKTA